VFVTTQLKLKAQCLRLDQNCCGIIEQSSHA